MDGPNINLTDRHRDADARSGVKKTDPCLQPRRQDHGKEEAGAQLRSEHLMNEIVTLVCTDARRAQARAVRAHKILKVSPCLA